MKRVLVIARFDPPLRWHLGKIEAARKMGQIHAAVVEGPGDKSPVEDRMALLTAIPIVWTATVYGGRGQLERADVIVDLTKEEALYVDGQERAERDG